MREQRRERASPTDQRQKHGGRAVGGGDGGDGGDGEAKGQRCRSTESTTLQCVRWNESGRRDRRHRRHRNATSCATATRHISYTDHITQRLLRAFLIIRASNYSQILIGALLGISGMILHSNWPAAPHRIYEFQFARCR